MQTVMSILLKTFISTVVLASVSLTGCTSARGAGQRKSARNTPERKEGVSKSVETVLEPRVENGKVTVVLSIRNPPSGEILQLEPRQLLRESDSVASMLELTCNGKPVSYRGKMEKSAATTSEQMILLKPGQDITGQADLTAQYDFLPGQHTYAVRYEAFATESNKGTLVALSSATKSFVFAAK